MEQKDYLLREIDKIGLILIAIWQKIFGGKVSLATSLENQIETVKEMLLNEAKFDLDKFLDSDNEESNKYLCSFESFNVNNIELLAKCISQIGFNEKSNNSKRYLEKALQLYDLCNLKSNTYSFERETNILTIKNAL
jgi:hypothetical protein